MDNIFLYYDYNDIYIEILNNIANDNKEFLCAYMRKSIETADAVS